MKRKLILISLVGILLISLVGLWVAGSVLSASANQPVGILPSDLGGTQVQFPSASGATLHGWFIPGKKGVGAIILMHGVRANRLSMLERARFLSHADYSVLLFDFQAHGESAGKHITFGHRESMDARAAVSFMQSNAPGESIGVIGVSLGGAAALLAAPPLEVEAMVLEMVYPTINEAISNRLTMRLGGWASALTPLLSWQLKPRLGVSAEALSPIDRIGRISFPKLLIAGEKDQHTTLEESQRMFEAASEPKELWIVNGAEHVDLYKVSTKEYEQRVGGFFGKYLRSPDKDGIVRTAASDKVS